MKPCPVCKGTGFREVEVGGDPPFERYRCRCCAGHGIVPDEGWPQPHEGVTGAERSGLLARLLGLDEASLEVRFFVVQLADHLWDATRVGEPAPKVSRMYDRINAPQPGDLVAEMSAVYRQEARGVGILLVDRWEWWTTDEEWQREKAEDADLTDDDRSVDHAWYVQYGAAPDDVCRWTNCSFSVVPTTRDFFRAVPAGLVDDTGATVFTRESLLGSLADSGFRLRLPPEEGR